LTYTLLIYRTTPPNPASDRASLAAHRAVQAEAAARGELHAVAQLADVLQAKVVRPGAHEVTDGPFIETKEWLVGFYLVDCASEEEALQRASALCTDGAHTIEVRPVTWRWDP
jgi:hypothetical protein